MKLKKFFVWVATFLVGVTLLMYRYPVPDGASFLYALGFRFGQAIHDPHGWAILALAAVFAFSAAREVKHR